MLRCLAEYVLDCRMLSAAEATCPSTSREALRGFFAELIASGQVDQALDLIVDLVERMREENDRRVKQLVLELRRRFGRSSEKLSRDDIQLALFEAESMAAPSGASPDADKGSEPTPEPKGDAKPRSRPTGRRPLPESLPRVIERLEPTDAEKQCATCGADKVCIGHEKSELLDFRPAQLIVIEQQRAKYACKACQDGVVIGPVGPKPIEGGLVGPGLLSHVVVSKYKDHLPLYRLSQILGRSGVEISDSTLGGWIGEAAVLLEPLWKRLRERALGAAVLAMDDTGIRVLDRDHAKGVKRGHLWCYVGYESGVPDAAVFDYTPDWKGSGPRAFLESRRGLLQCDGYKGLEPLFEGANPRCRKVGCWAHARRKFYEASQVKETQAAKPLQIIQALYRVEDEARKAGALGEERKTLRQARSVPLVSELRAWLDDHGKKVRPTARLGKAVTYATNQWASLLVFLEDGDIPIDNNVVENKIRPIALGRKNWLFAGNDQGAERAAIIYSIMASCALEGVEPFEYLRDVFDKLSRGWLDSRLTELLPREWAEARRGAPAEV